MKLLKMFRKDKPVPFAQFRDLVRLAARRSHPGATAQNTDTGFSLLVHNKRLDCNLRQVYADYCKTPGEKDALIQRYLESIMTEAPEQGWSDARILLRPMVKDNETLKVAAQQMAKAKSPDSLPSEPFVGDLSVIVVREFPGSVMGVTQVQLDAWGVTFPQALHEAINNMNMLNFPPTTNEMLVGGTASRKGTVGGEVVGMVFEGDHLTATWLTLERFRDFVGMRLQGDFVVSVPTRNRLVAVRVDEPGLIQQLRQTNRNFHNLPYALTAQLFHVNAASTGGVVTVYDEKGETKAGLDPSGAFAPGKTAPQLPNLAQQMSGHQRQQPVDFGALGGFSEPTGELGPPPPPSRGRGKG